VTRRSRERKLLPYPLDNPSDGQVPVFRASDGNFIWANPASGGPTNPDTNFIVTSSGFDAPGTQSGTVLNFDNGTRLFTIIADGGLNDTWTYTYNGQRYTITGALSIQIPDVEGLHYIYLEEDGNLVETTTFNIDIITEKALVSVIYWDATNSEAILFSDERHGNVMDPATHIYNHLTFGTRYESGLALFDMDVDGNGDDASAAQFGVTSGRIWDEDLPHDILPSGLEIPVFYQTGTVWRRAITPGFPVLSTGSGRLAWNEEVSPGTWQLSEVNNNDFVLYHYFATGDENFPIIGVVGQGDYLTLGQARAAAPDELTRLLFGELSNLTPEFAPIATVIFQTSIGYSNAVQARVRSTEEGDDYIDWRGFIPVGGATGAGGTSGTGVGLPVGGANGQVLVKQSAIDYDAGWRSEYAIKQSVLMRALGDASNTGAIAPGSPRTIQWLSPEILDTVGWAVSNFSSVASPDLLTWNASVSGRVRVQAQVTLQFTGGPSQVQADLLVYKNGGGGTDTKREAQVLSVSGEGDTHTLQVDFITEVTFGTTFEVLVEIVALTGSFTSCTTLSPSSWFEGEWLGVAP
jgi:hypothetical protein